MKLKVSKWTDFVLFFSVCADFGTRFRYGRLQVRVQAGLWISFRRSHHLFRRTAGRIWIFEFSGQSSHPLRHVQMPSGRGCSQYLNVDAHFLFGCRYIDGGLLGHQIINQMMVERKQKESPMIINVQISLQLTTNNYPSNVFISLPSVLDF